MMKVIFNNCPTSIFYYFKIFRRMYLKNSKFKFFQDICSNQKRKKIFTRRHIPLTQPILTIKTNLNIKI